VTGPVLDAHLHVWDLQVSDYAWLGPDHGALHRSFLPEAAEHELELAGVAAAVLVQAEDSDADTRYLLDVAERFSCFAGVVGWVALDDPARAAVQLADYGDRQAFCGVRHLVHDDPRPDFLELPAVRRSLRLLVEHGLAFEIPDAWPRHLNAVSPLADALPELTVVVDHLGKPPREEPALGAWSTALREVARRPNTVAKVSGLQAPGHPFTVEALRPVWEQALEVYGPERLMYGSDWPMTVPSGGYQTHWPVMAALIGELSPDEQQKVLCSTATSVYGIAWEGAR
jgi:L-fuconolactonase